MKKLKTFLKGTTMSTRSTIWMKNEDGTFTGIYCHWDGYIENNGKILFHHYQDLNKLKSLIALGSISYLCPNVSTNMPHSFDSPVPDVTVAYHRDRGEEFCQYTNIKEQDIPKYREEYNYFFVDGEWKYTEYDEKEMKSLKDAVERYCPEE